MQDLSLIQGAQHRDFADIVWQIAEKRACDEVVIRYDCGHAIRADVWAPALPKTREYGTQEAERRRFMQHSVYVLTKDPGAPKVQITIPEGRCRHCGRGQRQVLICGPLQMDLAEERRRNQPDPKTAAGRLAAALPLAALAPARRMELPLTSHAFLAAMGQVCRLPENVTPPPLTTSGGALKPFDGQPMPREGLRQWSRREVEDELRGQLVKYVGSATVVLLGIIAGCIYLCYGYLHPAAPRGSSAAKDVGFEGNASGGDSVSAVVNLTGPLANITTLGVGMEMSIANSTWMLSALTASVHKAFGPTSGTSLLWTIFVHPLWVVVSLFLAPVLYVVDLVLSIPRFIIMHIALAGVRGLIWKPCSWLFSAMAELLNSLIYVFRILFSRPTATLSQIPVTNPMAVAMVLSLLVAALSAPQPPSLPLPNIWKDLPNFEIVRSIKRYVKSSRSLGPIVQRLRVFWGARKDGRPKGGPRAPPGAGGHKATGAGAHAEAARGGQKGQGAGPPGGAGRQDGRAPANAASASQQHVPACFVCLDRPSRYVLEPCGHRVVCQECAVQLVEAAGRNRANSNEAAGGGGAHHGERGGTCPSCSAAITRAMRLFS